MYVCFVDQLWLRLVLYLCLFFYMLYAFEASQAPPPPHLKKQKKKLNPIKTFLMTFRLLFTLFYFLKILDIESEQMYCLEE